MARNAFYAQSGGVTAVINASASGVIETWRHYAQQRPDEIGKLYAGRFGILGALTEELIDTTHESDEAIAALAHTPGAVFGSCRYKLSDPAKDRSQYERLIEVFRAHDIGYFFYNGGNDSMDTALKVSEIAAEMNYPIHCIGIPKTIDNDLVETDCCPGFGSAAKYVAVAMREAMRDVEAMAGTSTRVFVMEVMGRHVGWLTAAASLAAEAGGPPILLLLPEVPFNERAFIDRVSACVTKHECCLIAVSEGLRDGNDRLLGDTGHLDAFGHAQLGGIGARIAELVRGLLGYKVHWALPDYLQRSARHLASTTDFLHAQGVGRSAVEMAMQGKSGIMMTVVRHAEHPYSWEIGTAPLQAVANREKMLPREFISDDGFGVSEACKRYLMPLLDGEEYPPYRNGLPDYVRFKNVMVEPKLSPFVP